MYYYVGRDTVKNNSNYECMCAYCEYATGIFDPEIMVCKKKGLVAKTYKCRKFIYDPLKRQPPKTVGTPKLDFIEID